VVYPATVPKTDPKYDTYIRKRALALYPPDENNNSTQTDIVVLD